MNYYSYYVDKDNTYCLRQKVKTNVSAMKGLCMC